MMMEKTRFSVSPRKASHRSCSVRHSGRSVTRVIMYDSEKEQPIAFYHV